MALVLGRCVPSDAQELAEAYLATFGGHPRHTTAYGGMPYSHQIAHYKAYFASEIAAQETPTPTRETHFLKVTDSTTGEIMSYGIWIWLPKGYFRDEDPQVNSREVPEGMNAELVDEFSRRTGEMRGAHEGRKGPHWLLCLLGTHPKHQRKGAGAMIVRWPFVQADEQGLRCYVDSSTAGYPLYRRCGFTKDVGRMAYDFGEYGAQGVGVLIWTAMLREPTIKEMESK